MYEFGETKFTDFVWIKNGDLFSNVTLVEIELNNAGSIRLEVVDKEGKVISKRADDKPHGGWCTFDFHAGMNPPVVSGMSPYKLRIVNASSGERVIKQGKVHTKGD